MTSAREVVRELKEVKEVKEAKDHQEDVHSRVVVAHLLGTGNHPAAELMEATGLREGRVEKATTGLEDLTGNDWVGLNESATTIDETVREVVHQATTEESRES